MNQETYYLLICFVFFAGTVLLSLLINGLFLKFSGTLGLKKINTAAIRWSKFANPSIGGLSFYILFLLSLLIHFVFFEAGNIYTDHKLLGVFASVTLAFLIGLADDAYNIKPFLKFAGQLACGLFLVFTGTTIHIFSSEILNGVLTLLWIIGIMNSINMLDNMDAITAIVSIFIILTALIIGMAQGELTVYIILLLGVLASLTGFLFYNWNPSKIFMGDTGSQFLGCMVAVFGIVYFWNYRDPVFVTPASQQIILVALAFLIPLCDTTIVVANRLIKRSSPFIGGKDHTTHHISYLGFSDKDVARIFLLLSAISLFFVYLIVSFIPNWNYSYFILFSSYILIVFSVLYSVTRIKKTKKQHNKNITTIFK